jgi:hypothetical protein
MLNVVELSVVALVKPLVLLNEPYEFSIFTGFGSCQTWFKCYKTFYTRKLQILVIS